MGPGKVQGTTLCRLVLSPKLLRNLLLLQPCLLADLEELKGSSRAERGVPHYQQQPILHTRVAGETQSYCQSVQEGAAGSHFTAFHLELFQYLYLFLRFLYVFLPIKKKKERGKKEA